jgi:hypothetical protein
VVTLAVFRRALTDGVQDSKQVIERIRRVVLSLLAQLAGRPFCSIVRNSIGQA